MVARYGVWVSAKSCTERVQVGALAEIEYFKYCHDYVINDYGLIQRIHQRFLRATDMAIHVCYSAYMLSPVRLSVRHTGVS